MGPDERTATSGDGGSTLGVGPAELGELAVASARINLSSSCRAAVLAAKSIDYHLSSASRLESLGDPADCRGKVASGARFIRVP